MLLAVAFLGGALAADYVFERTVIKGVGYRSHELISQTKEGYSGQKLVERIAGTGSFDDRTVFEVDVVQNSINFTQEASFEYFPVSYQTGTYDRKWRHKICVINYDAGAVLTEAYAMAEQLHKSTEIRTIGNRTANVLEAGLNTDVIGVVHIGWVSKSNETRRGRYLEVGRSSEDLVGVFSIDKYVQLRGNVTDSDGLVDWLPCY
jgi:hypothetical protein